MPGSCTLQPGKGGAVRIRPEPVPAVEEPAVNSLGSKSQKLLEPAMRQLSPRNQHSHAAANQRRQILQGIDRKVVMGHGFSNEHENGFNGASPVPSQRAKNRARRGPRLRLRSRLRQCGVGLMLRLPTGNPSARVVRPRERPGLVFCRACRRSTPALESGRG